MILKHVRRWMHLVARRRSSRGENTRSMRMTPDKARLRSEALLRQAGENDNEYWTAEEFTTAEIGKLTKMLAEGLISREDYEVNKAVIMTGVVPERS